MYSRQICSMCLGKQRNELWAGFEKDKTEHVYNHYKISGVKGGSPCSHELYFRCNRVAHL